MHRSCMGAYLAEIEAKVILQMILTHDEVLLVDPNHAVQIDGGFTLRPNPDLSV